MLVLKAALRPMNQSALTRHADMTAAPVELLTGARAALLLGFGKDMDVVWSVLQSFGQSCKARAIIFSCPVDGSGGPVSPEDVLLEDSHGEGVLDPTHNHLTVLTSQ